MALWPEPGRFNVTSTKTANYTAAYNDFVVCDTTAGPFIVTLPAATAGSTVAIRKSDSSLNVVVISPAGSDTIGIVSPVVSMALSRAGQDIVLIGVSGAWVPEVGGGESVSAAPLLTVGEETIRRDEATANTNAITSGDVRLTYFDARKTETTTQVRVYSGTTAAGATPTLCRIGLYSIAADGSGTLVASTANDTTLFAASSTAYTRSWSSSYLKTAGLRYAMGIIVVTAAATPTFIGQATNSALRAENALERRLNAKLLSQTDLPSTFVSSSFNTTIDARYYGVILP